MSEQREGIAMDDPRIERVARSDIAMDTQLCLETAARLAFPDGSVSARTLRAEAARGKLAIFRIGKKYYTTLAAIEKMVVEKCPVPPKVRIYLDARSSPSASQLSSGTGAMKSARAALKLSMEKLRQ